MTVQLPNTWHFVAVVLACARIGAVAGPMLPIMRAPRGPASRRDLTESPVYLGSGRAHRGFRPYAHALRRGRRLRSRPCATGCWWERLAARADGSTDPGLDGALDFDEGAAGAGRR